MPPSTQHEASGRTRFFRGFRLRAGALRSSALAPPLLALTLALAAREEIRIADGRLYDLRVRLHAPFVERRAPLVWIALDNESLARLEPSVGRWPWPRAVWASVVEYADAAAVIGMDLLLTEEDRTYPGSDDALAESVAHHGNVVATAFINRTDGAIKGPYPQLAKTVRAVGHVEIEPDADGVVRRYTGELRARGGALPSLAHATAAAFLDRSPDELPGRSGFRMVPSGDPPEIYSVADVIEAWKAERSGEVPRLSREAFRGKIVLIGSFATGLPADKKMTSRATAEPGVLIVGTAIDNLLAHRFYRRPPPAVDDALAALAAFAPLLLGAMRPRRFALLMALLFLLYASLSVFAALAFRVMLPTLGPTASAAVAATGLLAVYWDRDRRARLRLEELEAAKQRFTDMLVHDLRNRIFSAQASLKLLGGKLSAAPAAARELLAVSAAGIQRMSVEVQALLDIRKMEEGRLPVAPAVFEVESLLREVADEYGPAAAAADTPIRLEATPARIRADRALLARALGNLIFNALQHARADSELLLRNERADGCIVLTVANRGPVLTDEARAALFQPFAVRPDQPRPRGTGLGLTFCKLTAEAHGGSVRIESPWAEAGDGVAVRLHLPGALDNSDGLPDDTDI